MANTPKAPQASIKQPRLAGSAGRPLSSISSGRPAPHPPADASPGSDPVRPLRAPVSRLPVLLTIEQVTQQLSVCDKTVRRLIRDGKLHAHRVGRQLRVSEEDLVSYLAPTRR